jgi:hypothetical protein
MAGHMANLPLGQPQTGEQAGAKGKEEQGGEAAGGHRSGKDTGGKRWKA